MSRGRVQSLFLCGCISNHLCKFVLWIIACVEMCTCVCVCRPQGVTWPNVTPWQQQRVTFQCDAGWEPCCCLKLWVIPQNKPALPQRTTLKVDLPSWFWATLGERARMQTPLAAAKHAGPTELTPRRTSWKGDVKLKGNRSESRFLSPQTVSQACLLSARY